MSRTRGSPVASSCVEVTFGTPRGRPSLPGRGQPTVRADHHAARPAVRRPRDRADTCGPAVAVGRGAQAHRLAAASLRTAAWALWWHFERGEKVPRDRFRPMPKVDAGWLIAQRRGTPLLPTSLAPADLLRPTWQDVTSPSTRHPRPQTWPMIASPPAEHLRLPWTITASTGYGCALPRPVRAAKACSVAAVGVVGMSKVSSASSA